MDNFFDYLPDELLECIFGFYTSRGNANCYFVCKRWNKIIKTNFTFCNKCKKFFKNNSAEIHEQEHQNIERFHIYATTYNFLRLASGMARMSYST